MKVTIAVALIALVLGGLLIAQGLDDRAHVRCGEAIMKTTQQCKVADEIRSYSEQREATGGDWKVNVGVGAVVILLGVGRAAWALARARPKRGSEPLVMS